MKIDVQKLVSRHRILKETQAGRSNWKSARQAIGKGLHGDVFPVELTKEASATRRPESLAGRL